MAKKKAHPDDEEHEIWSGVLGGLIAQTMKDITLMIKLDISDENLCKIIMIDPETIEIKLEKVPKPC